MPNSRRNRILVVEDDSALNDAICRVARQHAQNVVGVFSVSEALRVMEEWEPDMLVLDIRLPDGSGVAVAQEASRRSPAPAVIAASGAATAAEAFDLGQAGVRTFLSKPFTLKALEEAICRAEERVPPINAALKAQVGKRELLDVVSDVRSTMIGEAIAKAQGNLAGAARALGVSRQAVQQLVRKRHRADPKPVSERTRDEAESAR